MLSRGAAATPRATRVARWWRSTMAVSCMCPATARSPTTTALWLARWRPAPMCTCRCTTTSIGHLATARPPKRRSTPTAPSSTQSRLTAVPEQRAPVCLSVCLSIVCLSIRDARASLSIHTVKSQQTQSGQRPSYTHPPTCTDMHTRTYTQAHMHTHAKAHTRTQSRRHTHTNIDTHTHTQARTRTLTRRETQTHGH
jgi:hypothetical protein